MDTAMTRSQRSKQGGAHDANWNLAAPVLQESANSMVDGVGFTQLSAMYSNNAAQGQLGTALEDAQNLTAYKTTPEEMRQRERVRLSGKDGKVRIPGYVWALGAVGVFLLMSRR
jgi:hypothetical protein